jgi:hypothetical protein
MVNMVNLCNSFHGAQSEMKDQEISPSVKLR